MFFLQFIQGLSLKIKLAILITFLVSCISFISVILSLNMASNQANQTMDSLIKTAIWSNSDYLSDFILTDNRWELFKFLKNLTSSDSISAAGFILPDNIIVAHTETAIFRMGGLFEKIGEYETIPFFKDGVMLGSFVLKLKKQSLWDLIIDMFIVQILLTLGFAILALIVAHYFVTRTTNRLDLLVQNTKAMSQKKWDEILPNESNEKDEISILVDNTTELMHDIRHALEQEEQLKDFYHSILSQIDTLIVIFNANMDIQFHNNHALHIHILDAKKKIFLPSVLEKMGELFEFPSQTVAIPIKDNDKTLSLLLRVERIQDNYVASIIDISLLKKQEQNARISHSLNILGEISASFAHEIKNLLQPLKLLLPKDSLPDKEDLSIIHTTLTRMDGQVSDFLSLGRPSVSKGVVSSVLPVLDEIIDQSQKQIKSKNLAIKVESKETFYVALDAQSLHLLCINLFSNALEAAYAGSEISVILQRHEKKMIRMSFKNEGSPMSSHVKKNLFKPFFTTKKDGSGLGLFAVYKIAYLNGGFLEVKQDKEFIIFHIFLPIGESSCK